MDVLNLGAGNEIMEGATNHDRTLHRSEIAVAHDLNELPWPWEDGSFDVIVARAVLEHLRITLVQSMDECWRILRPGGRIVLKVPYWKNESAYTDPTHYWRFSLQTPDLFDPETPYGRAYRFYGQRPWKIVKPARLNAAGSSIHVTLEVRKDG